MHLFLYVVADNNFAVWTVFYNFCTCFACFYAGDCDINMACYYNCSSYCHKVCFLCWNIHTVRDSMW